MYVYKNKKQKNKNMKEKIKILLVNTDYSLRLFFSEEKFEFVTVSIAQDLAASAIAICAENKDIDICLVNGYVGHMAGFEAAESIKQICPNLPIISVSEFDIPEHYKRFFVAHFENGSNLGRLQSTIYEYVLKS
jgi:CheY-like chemotaxis protein